jgi:hypothetical protein
MSETNDARTPTPGEVVEGGRVAILDPQAVEEGRRSAHARSHIGALTELAEEDGASEPVTRQMVTARLRVLEDARTKMLDELAVLQGKVVGLREILAADVKG